MGDKKRYGQWAGRPNGQAYKPEQCKYEVFSSKMMIGAQCSRPCGYGEDGLYCKQHAKKHPAVETLKEEEHY
jgi:hypothetical protein